MGMAEIANAPVLIVGDIDKGGVFASLAGTMLLLNNEERKRVKGTIINKFRGDVEILKPGLTMLEDIIHIPCLGVVPYFRLMLEDEDGAIEFSKKVTAPIDIAVIKLPHISNFTDIDPLKNEKDVSIRFIESKEEFGNPDILIIPGSKNTIGDLIALRKTGLEDLIKEYSNIGNIIGICGGYQMLGRWIKDPYGVETDEKEIEGMNLLDIGTVFNEEKTTTRIEAETIGLKGNMKVYGYEIHMGICEYGNKAKKLFEIVDKNGEKANYPDGTVNEKGNIMGTYIHGIFDGTEFREYILNNIRSQKGLPLRRSDIYESLRDKELNKLADIVRDSIDMKRIYKIVGRECI